MSSPARKSTKAPATKAPATKAPKAPKAERRPQAPTAYQFFLKAQRSSVQRQHPEADFAELSKIVGDAWKALPQDEKAAYVKQAADAKAELVAAELQAKANRPPPRINEEGVGKDCEGREVKVGDKLYFKGQNVYVGQVVGFDACGTIYVIDGDTLWTRGEPEVKGASPKDGAEAAKWTKAMVKREGADAVYDHGYLLDVGPEEVTLTRPKDPLARP